MFCGLKHRAETKNKVKKPTHLRLLSTINNLLFWIDKMHVFQAEW